MSEQIGGDYWPDQGEMIYHMAYLEEMASKCSVIVEIGCGHGNGSTRAFERGLRRTTHPAGAKLFVSVDNKPQQPEVRPTIPCWYKVTGDSRDPMSMMSVDALIAESRPCLVSLIYIDTDHTYEQLAEELPVWERLATESTIWLFHDTFMNGVHNHMTDAITDFCKSHPEWEYVEVTKESHGMGMMRRKI